MAGLVDNSTTYTGKDALGFYSTALLTGNSKSKVRQVVNIKDKMKLASLDMGDFLQADACVLEEDGSYTLDQKELAVCDLGFKVPFCSKDWEGVYLSEQLRAGSNIDDNYPTGVVDYILGQMAIKISELTERLFFRGDTAGSPADLCDGLQKKLLADATVIDVAVDGTKISGPTTVIAELTRMYNAIPATLDKSKLIWFITPATESAFMLSIPSSNPALYAINGAKPQLSFLGMPLTVANGLGAQKSIIADPMNLWFGTDLLSDELSIEFIQDPINKKVNFAIGSFKWGVNFGIGAEIVYYN